MDVTADAVTALAPDASGAAAGRKLAAPSLWKVLGRSDAALWGECQGSALYQVHVERASLTAACTCPSRKLPCKHALALLYLAADNPGALPVADQPAGVTDWLAKRAAAQARQAKTAALDTSDGPDSAGMVAVSKPTAQTKRADRRRAAVAAGLDALDLWLSDLVRNGLATVETQPATFWERQAARLVDAQAPGVAGRLRRMAFIPNASPDWPARLLAELGKLALLTEAYRRIDTLDGPLQDDVRAALGWTLKEDEVLARGEHVDDDWIVAGQTVQREDRLRVQRTWLVGSRTRRAALVMQFAVGEAPFAQVFAPATRLEATLVYWPGAAPQRALVHARRSAPAAHRGPLPGLASLDLFCDEIARATARQPWLDRALLVLSGAVPCWGEGTRWSLHDTMGHSLPLAKGEYWDLLAHAGGHPIDVVAEWNGASLRPLGLVASGTYHRVRGTE